MMGWGNLPHEGSADRKAPDGRWLGLTTRSGDFEEVARQAVCECGWRSPYEHLVPPRPRDVERDERGIPHGAVWDAWIAEVEAAEGVCYEDWRMGHYEPLLGYEPETQLVLARTEGGPRHFLAGLPVPAGATLELLLDDGDWVSIRYEWSWRRDELPQAYIALGVPNGARAFGERPAVSFELPSTAILRWPRSHER